MFEKIKKYFVMGIYKETHINKLFAAGALTQSQYDELITMKVIEVK